MNLKLFFLSLLYILYYLSENCNSETMTYISTEHPVMSWFDTKYFNNFTFTSRRISRQDPRYYVDIYVNTLITWNNQIKLDFYFYQFLTNRYQPSFVEMHFKFCNLLDNDIFFGSSVKRALGNQSCPFPPGEYELTKMYIPYVPKGFPFVKGRIVCNITYERSGVSSLVASGSIDMEVKVAKIINNGKKGEV